MGGSAKTNREEARDMHQESEEEGQSLKGTSELWVLPRGEVKVVLSSAVTLFSFILS